jgi:hypothetical protein
LIYIDFQYNSNIWEASRPTYWGGLGGRMPQESS